MAVDSPFENELAYNAITIDKQDTPGVCKLVGGGDRKLKIESQQSPGFGGAFTICRGEEVPTLDYEIRVWTDEEHKKLQKLAERLRAAQKPRPPKVLSLVDLCISHNGIAQVVVASVGKIEPPKDGNGIAIFQFGFSEWRKRKPIGGVPKRPKNDVELEIERLNTDNAGLDKQLEAMKAAAERGL